MMDELSPQARALLDGARGATGPDAAAIARMRAKIDATVVAGATSGGIAGVSLATKLSVVSVLAVVAIGALVYSSRTPAAAPSPVVHAATTAPALEAPAPTREAPVVDSDHEIANEIEMPVEAVALAPKLVVPPPAKRPPARPRAIDLAREVELVDRAHAASKRGDFAAALAAVQLHHRETGGRGQLAEDAAAIEIEATCRSGRRATALLAAFDRRFPSSAQRARIAAACP